MHIKKKSAIFYKIEKVPNMLITQRTFKNYTELFFKITIILNVICSCDL